MSDERTNLFGDLRVSAEDIRKTDWLTIIRRADEPQIDQYSMLLFEAARRAKDDGDRCAEQVYTLLGAAASMFFDGSDASEPFKPLFTSPTGRSAALGDFEDQHLDPITAVYAEIEDSEMRARLADLLWIRRRDHSAAGVAVSEYLKQAQSLFDPVHWNAGFKRLNRAMQIAGALGKKRKELGQVTKYALNVLHDLEALEPTPLTPAIIELLLTYGSTDARSLAVNATAAAKKAEASGNWMEAGSYWGMAALCHRKTPDEAQARVALQAQGEAWVTVGEEMAASGVKGLAYDHWVERGFHVLRNAGAPIERQNEVQRRLHQLQESVVKNLISVDLGEPVGSATQALVETAKGLSFTEAVHFLAAQSGPLPKKLLSDQVKTHMQDSVVFNLMGMTLRREDGKIEAKIPPFPPKGSPPDEVLDLYLWRMAAISQPVFAWPIEHVRRIINEEHPWENGMFDWLLTDNLFVPEGREVIYERGLKAGLEGDYLVATHLLVPQLENSIRYVLNQRGFITTFVRQDGAYDEHPLTEVAKSEAFVQVFGVDMAFAIRGLLSERAGSNLRNHVCHGLASIGGFYGTANVCLLGLALVLLLQGMNRPSE